MKFYYLNATKNRPIAGLIGADRGTRSWGGQMVSGIIPSTYKLDVWYSARTWPDYLDSLDCVLWSQRVVDAFQESGFSGVEFYPQVIREIDSNALRKLPDPHYHWAHAISGVPALPGNLEVYPTSKNGYLDIAAFDFRKFRPFPLDVATGFYGLQKRSGLCLWKFDFSQWQGADLFYISTAKTRMWFCTQRFKDLVESNKFTNFRFTGALNPEGDWFFA